jgi:hypothetical protein
VVIRVECNKSRQTFAAPHRSSPAIFGLAKNDAITAGYTGYNEYHVPAKVFVLP